MREAMRFDVDRSNSRQLRDWDGEHGSYWAEYADLYDRSLAGYHPAVLAAANAGPGRPDPGRRLRLRSGRDRPGPQRHRVRAPSGSTCPRRNSTWPGAAGPGWRWSSLRPTRRCTTSGQRRTT